MKPVALSLLLIFSTSLSIASEELSDCAVRLMSQPMCVTKINAESFCKTFPTSNASSDGILNSIEDCFKKYRRTNMDQKNLTLLCLGQVRTSTSEDANVTFCN